MPVHGLDQQKPLELPLRIHNASSPELPDLPLDPPVHVYFVRHGLSEGNANGILQGSVDAALSQEGEAQAAALAEQMKELAIDAVIASDLQRARRTAEILAAPHGIREIGRDPRIREIDSGILEGRKIVDNIRDFPELYRTLRTQMADFSPPGGESCRDVFERGAAFLRETLPLYRGKTLLVTTHGFLLATLVNYFKGRPFEAVLNEIYDNTSVSELLFYNLREFDVIRLNDTAHLGGKTLPSEGGAAASGEKAPPALCYIRKDRKENTK